MFKNGSTATELDRILVKTVESHCIDKILTKKNLIIDTGQF